MGEQPLTGRQAPAWRRYLRFWGRDAARDLDDELSFHIAARYDECLAAGMTPEAARIESERRFGDVVRVRAACERIDSQWERERSMTDIARVIATDLRYATRQLRRNASLNVAAVLCLALGIGATTAIFSVVNGVLYRPLPLREPDRLVLVGEGLPMFNDNNMGVISRPEYTDYQRLDGRIFSGSAVYESQPLSVGGGTSDPERVDALLVSSNFLDVLGVTPAHGRDFSAADADTGAARVAIISDALWHRRFDGNVSAVGTQVDVEGRPTTIVGVLPPSLQFPLPGIGGAPSDIYVPLRFTAGMENMRGNAYGTWLVGRLAPGVPLAAARRAVNDVAATLPTRHPQSYAPNWKTVADALPLRDRAVKDVRGPLLILLAAVALVLLTACINVSGLLLARADARSREIAVRQSLGASFWRLVQQFLVESALLVAAGGSIGVLIAVWVTRYLGAHAPNDSLHGYLLTVDGRVLAVASAACALTAIVFSLLPALSGGRKALSRALVGTSRSSTAGVGQRSGRKLLVVAQVALALVLAASASLMIRSFVNAREIDPGFESRHLLTFRTGLPVVRYPAASITEFESRMIETLRRLPGVRNVSLTSHLPLSGAARIAFTVEGASFDKFPLASSELVFPEYFEAMGTRLVAGRGITSADVAGSQPVAVINEALARQYFPTRNPIGQRLKWGGPRSSFAWTTVVGVAKDVRQMGVDQQADPEVYFAALQQDSATAAFLRGPALLLRTTNDPRLLLGAVQRAVRAIDDRIPIVALRPMSDDVGDSLDGRQFNTVLLAAFAGLALALSSIGIYGLMAHSVVQRTREIGVRIAVGAMPGQVVRFILAQGARLAVAGILIGMVLAVGATRVLRTLLFGVTPLDLVSFAIAAVSLLLVALVAAYLPARRAARIDPQRALRSE